MLGCLCREQAATPGVYLHNPVNEFYKSIRSCLRNDHWYQKLVWSYREWHLVTRITFGKLRPTSHWCFLCPDKSMAPVLAITDMVARARRDDSLL